jgi:IS4 transposase
MLSTPLRSTCVCLFFQWAKFRKQKGAIKVHTLIDVVTRIPSVIRITPGNIHEVRILDELFLEPGAIYLMDRGYMDFKRLHRLHSSGAFFVIRAKKNARFKHSESRPVDKQKGFRCDQTVHLVSPVPAAAYPDGLRRISYVDPEKQKRLVFLTNNFQWSVATIAALYKSRWRVELFFKWIKQNLRIKTFYGTTENAVKTQIWIAVIVYLLAAIMKKQLNLSLSLASILQVLSVTPFEKTPLQELLCENAKPNSANDSCKQLTLFDL